MVTPLEPVICLFTSASFLQEQQKQKPTDADKINDTEKTIATTMEQHKNNGKKTEQSIVSRTMPGSNQTAKLKKIHYSPHNHIQAHAKVSKPEFLLFSFLLFSFRLDLAVL